MDGTEAAVLARAQAGDGEAFRTLVEQHSQSVFRVAYRMTGNEHDAEEVVQETFLRAYRQLGRFESRANLGTWLYRIAINCSVDLLRTRVRHDEKRAPETAGGDPLALVAAEGPSADRLLFSAQVQRAIEQGMRGMSDLERAAFTLRHFEGHSIEEIGRALDMRTSAVKHSIFRAVKKLRSTLGPICADVKRGES